MRPQVMQGNTGSAARTIYINPNFNRNISQSNDAVKIGTKDTIATSTHFNPLFLASNRSPAIHMNPHFFHKKIQEQNLLQQQRLKEKLEGKTQQKEKNPSNIHSVQTTNEFGLPQISDKKIIVHKQLLVRPLNGQNVMATSIRNNYQSAAPLLQRTVRKIISKSRTKIIREPAVIDKNYTTTPTPAPFIRLSRRKLVRRANVLATINAVHDDTTCISPNAIGKYKLDRRRGLPRVESTFKTITPGLKVKRNSFVARYALRRSNIDPKAISMGFKLRSLPVNKQLQMLNINGVLYRSTRNKLQRKDPAITPSNSSALRMKSKTNINTAQKLNKAQHRRTLFVHGTKFVLDESGFKMTRITPACNGGVPDLLKSEEMVYKQRQRIDIGGLTYIASSNQNVYVCNRNHLALAHLNTAKQRSLQLLTRRLVKSNIPCAIYQRIGKCIAHERGKCNKVHDKRQVTICQRFLRSECHNTSCLLSHNVSLAKMPVCKFFLQGVCVRSDCPYLHKKLSVNADICRDFLRGYCSLAQQCNKRHEFLCQEFERSGKCETANCVYCKNRERRRFNEQPKQTSTGAVGKSNASGDIQNNATVPLRYFCDNDTKPIASDTVHDNGEAIHETTDVKSMVNDANSEVPTPVKLIRPKVGTLPAYIPLS